jgi:hypothetical protein
MPRRRPQTEPAPETAGAFLRRLPIALALSMLLWFLLRPGLDVGVSWLSETLTRAFEYPKATRLEVVDHRAQVRRSDLHAKSGIPAIPLTEIHFNTIVLLALYLSLRRPLSRRQLERLLMGWSLLFVSQSLNLLFHLKIIYSMQLGEWSLRVYSDLDRNVYGFLRYFTDLPGRFSFPFLIWVGFNWDRVMALIGPAPAAEAGADQRRRRK